MTWGSLTTMTVVVTVLILYEWPKLRSHSAKEKVVFLVITIAGWGLALLLVLFPKLPGPTQLVNYIYGPLGKLLE